MSAAVKVIVGEGESVEINVVGEGESTEVVIPGYGVIKGQDGKDGVSPVFTTQPIEGGYRLTIKDAAHPDGQDIDLMDGATGPQGDPGDENVFTARYGVTTENELSAARNEKKYIYAVGDGIPYQLYALSDVKFDSEPMVGEGYVFVFARLDGTTLKRVQLKYGVWSTLNDIELAESGTKLDIYQGPEYAGQPMIVGPDGYVVPQDSGGVLVEDGDGNVWCFVAGEGRAGDIVIEDENGNLWHALAGEGRVGGIPLEDSEGGVWHLPAGAGYSGGGELPPGGTDGQYLVKDSSAPGGVRWADLPTFSPTAETWTVTPLVGAETTLATAGKYLDRNIQVEAIPYAEVTNVSGGKTATIGG